MSSTKQIDCKMNHSMTPSTAIPGTIIKIQEIKIYNWLKRKRKGDGRGNRLAVDC
jgi:hypothetical protein